MNQAIYVMLGFVGSGKSTFAKRLSNEIKAVRLNGDELRRVMFSDLEQIRNKRNNPMVFGALDYAAEQIIKAKMSVIYDVSHNKISDRSGKAQMAARHNISSIVIWVQTPLDTARQRNEDRKKIDATAAVPLARLNEMASGMQQPQPGEKCIVIDGQQPFEQQFAAFTRQLAQLESTQS